jgi:DNA-binding response OmpR family regulator
VKVTTPSPAATTRGFPLSGSLRVLVVEDDPGVLKLMVSVLGAAGYQAQGAASAREAEALAGRSDPFDLLVTDLVLPDHSGVVLAERLRADRPDLTVLFCSGYDEDRLAGHGAQGSVLRKPFGPSELLAKVRELTLLVV